MNASYLRYGRGESLNAQDARKRGLLTASQLAKKIGKKVSAADIDNSLGADEWHHVGGYAAKVYFYSPELTDEELEKVFQARDRRLGEVAERWRVSYTLLTFTKRSFSNWDVTSETLEEIVTFKGDWLTRPDGSRVKLFGKRIQNLKRLEQIQ